MAIEVCVRCGAKTVKTEKCGYCNRMLCRNCLKSCRKPSRTEKLCICKDCWSKMGKRSEYKKVEKKVEDEYESRDFGRPRGRGRMR